MAYYLTTYCDGSEGPVIDSGLFPVISGVYFIYFTGQTLPGCYTIGEETLDPPTEGVISLILYIGCDECNRLQPRSAGTEYFECVICCDCGATGGTVTQVVPPHPVWTDGYGTPVTQLNMATLGGMFGLNN